MQPIRFFRRAAIRWPEAVAVEDGATAITYRDLAGRVDAVAAGLQALDPAPGSRVAICCYNDLEHLTAWLAVLAAGKIWVPLFPQNPAPELARAVAFTEASIVVAADEHRDIFGDSEARVISTGTQGQGSLKALVGMHSGSRPREHFLPLDASQAIKFTGGTTGRPKGVLQPYRAWNATIVTQIMAWDLAPGQRYLAAAPITHGTSTYILPTLATGGTIVLLDRPRPEKTLEALQHGRIATTFLPPTVLYMLMQLPGADRGDYRHIRNIVYGGGPMRPEAIGRAQSVFGPVLASTYGQTEAPQIATMISADDLMRPEKRASVGRETPLASVAVMGDGGRLLEPGETGEIVIRGDLLMTGYWRQPEVTAQTIVDGWLHTGDLGLIDAEGYVFIRGRAKDMIITGGFNVYPADVEPLLGEHPAVADCAVFGVPDEKWGEAVHAAVQPVAGAEARARDILAFARERLGPVKTPKTITFYPRLPRNQIGKLQKDELVGNFIARRPAPEEG